MCWYELLYNQICITCSLGSLVPRRMEAASFIIYTHIHIIYLVMLVAE